MTNKSIIFLFLISLFIFSGCGEDEANPSEENQLLGTWDMKDIVYSGTSTTSFSGMPDVTATFNGESIESDYQITFNADNTFESSGSYTINLTYEFMGQSITQPFPVSGAQALGSGTWEMVGNTLKTTVSGQSAESSIVELSENSFSLETELSQVQSASGATVTFDVEAVFNATK